MKKLITILAILGLFLGLAGSVNAAVRVKSYYKPSTGKFIQSHYRSNPNSYRFDNFSTKGNYNPFTGKKGYTSPYKSYRLGW